MTTRRQDSGQVLPLFVLALVAIFAMVALAVDGSNLFAQQRMSQNAVDAAAMAGAIAIAEDLAAPGSRTDADVANAVSVAAGQAAGSTADGVNRYEAVYTDGFGGPLAGSPVGAGGDIPAGARGVQVVGTRDMETTFARVPPIGIQTLPATAYATAIAGLQVGPCPPDTRCAVLPVTMPVSFGNTICDEDLASLGMANPGTSWTTITDPDDPAQTIPANLSVLPLCLTASGDFSWLDLGPDNLQQEILNPGGQQFLIPEWIQTQPGNPNSADTEINTYRGMVVLVPMWQALCGNDPGDINAPCTDPVVNGNNTFYAIPYMRPLLLEGAYTQGDNRADCTVAGVTWPPDNGPGSVPGLIGCIKGWWLDTTVTGGPVDPNRPIDGDAAIGVQLIK
jgi:hypothetical protein